METTIHKIETYYHQYLDLTSNVMLNLNTDTLISRIESLPQCKQIICELINRHPISDDTIESLVETHEIKELLEKTGESYYVAFCLQWYYYQKRHKRFQMRTYADKVIWLTLKDKESTDKIKIFKTDFIRPIIDYLISQIKECNTIYYYLDRYKSRVERYTFNLLEKMDEPALHKDLELYLFDQFMPFYHEPNLGRGRPDFVIDLECNDKPFVIEIKRMNVLKQGIIDEYLRQLKAYLGQFPSYGCLYIFTKDTRYTEYPKYIDDNLTIRCVYLGEKRPSQL